METTFDRIETEVYRILCEEARKYMSKLLKTYDDDIFKNRDKKRYRVTGMKKTAVKTMFGEVEFERRKYAEREDGKAVRSVYLLDDTLGIFGVGKISNTLAQVIVRAAAQQSFRGAAEAVSRMTGQTISHAGVWNVIQTLGETINKKEQSAVELLKKDIVCGKEETPVLFEEADGVYISMQGKDRKKYRKRKQEIKVGLAYKGCKTQEDGKVKLVGKVAVAGFYSTDEFHKRREAMIRRKYNTDEIKTEGA